MQTCDLSAPCLTPLYDRHSRCGVGGNGNLSVIYVKGDGRSERVKRTNGFSVIFDAAYLTKLTLQTSFRRTHRVRGAALDGTRGGGTNIFELAVFSETRVSRVRNSTTRANDIYP